MKAVVSSALVFAGAVFVSSGVLACVFGPTTELRYSNGLFSIAGAILLAAIYMKDW